MIVSLHCYKNSTIISMDIKKIENRRVVYDANMSFKYESEALLTTAMHCHEVYELLSVTAGHGKAFIGDSVFEYSEGDMILIGYHLPHLFIANQGILPRNNRCNLLQFPCELFPEDMDCIPEYSSVSSILRKSMQGVRFCSNPTKYIVTRLLKTLNRQRGVNRIFSLLRILDILDKSKEQKLIATSDCSVNIMALSAKDPISVLSNYMMNNHKRKLTLAELADQVHMNQSSLCRYFKAQTNKTLFQYLNEIRIEYACKLLRNTVLTVSQVAWESGFENLSHFNTQFRLITKQTPTEYRNETA